ncbi:MAG: undecaprenyl-diphosphate phosphatase [Gammaproteobacteria bacterium]|nr:undecaprenyl-diphosphate phosphatase [Gammaproteobacteria bacterium]
MDFTQILVLAILQGLTEFLPISSSAHLILVPTLVGWPDQGLAFDVAVHVGTLCAVMAYFRRELVPMSRDWVLSITTRQQTADSRLAWGVIIGTIPVGIVGLLFKDYIEIYLRSPLVIATTTIIFGLLLWWADAYSNKRHKNDTTNAEQKNLRIYGLSLKDVLIIGGAQALALIPGTSRSGITMTAGLFLGLGRDAAARFSFLLSIPVIILSGGLKTLDLIQSALPVEWGSIAIGATLSGLVAYLCIHFFLKLLDRVGMLPFVIYRLILGVILFAVFL